VPLAAFGALTMTLALVVGRPRLRGVPLSPLMGAVPGVLAMLAFGVLCPADLVRGARMLWRPLLTIACIMSTTSVAHRLGIFDRASRAIEIRTRGPVSRAFTATYVICAVTATLFNNDAAILLLTPVIVPVIRRMYPKRPYLTGPFAFAIFTSAGVAPLATSNPMNLVVAEQAHLAFNGYALRMIPVALAGTTVSYVMLRLAYRKELDDDVPGRGKEAGSLQPLEATSYGVLGIVALVFLSYPLLSYFDGPVWVAATGGAVFTALLGLRTREVSLSTLRHGVAWEILGFLYLIFVTALGLENVGIARWLSALYGMPQTLPAQLAVVSGTSALGSAVMNNHPMAAVNALVLRTLHGDVTWRTLAALVGGDLGPRLLPMGSLAGLLWLDMAARLGVEVKTREFVRIGVLTTLPALAASFAVLWLEALLWPSALVP
jgi:arsenical pump membrane protein